MTNDEMMLLKLSASMVAELSRAECLEVCEDFDLLITVAWLYCVRLGLPLMEAPSLVERREMSKSVEMAFKAAGVKERACHL